MYRVVHTDTDGNRRQVGSKYIEIEPRHGYHTQYCNNGDDYW